MNLHKSPISTTVMARKHISNILGKLNVDNRTQSVAEARRLGLVP